jgi:hypothetical protein
MITWQELTIREKYKSVEAINAELRRIAPIIQNHHIWAQWGNVEHREAWRRMCRYRKMLQELKKERKGLA